ncbi:GNAT family N-acetyltransferase [uncultured Jatrophihabitans sp.]|uniref:GNAT family N-acetyltransferase n=1 Tax=uncultured Jatrophihabitans sp. TaxID=1610747 RepID=UPI0035C9AB13
MAIAARLWGITIDCIDVPTVAAFWARLLGADAVPDEDLPGWLRIEPSQSGAPRLNFQPVAEPKQGKVRIHLDLRVDDIDAGIATVRELGGATTGERHDHDAGVVVVVADPEEHEFCIVQLYESAPPVVRLREMTDAEYDAWESEAIGYYTQDIVDATAESPQTAAVRAEQQLRELLPDGRQTPGMHLYRVLDADETPVGILWLGPHRRRPGVAFVYDITLDEEHRGRGLGRAAMLAAEQAVRDSGTHTIGLNVFGFNDRARRLYDSLGYRVEATQMTKDL